MQIFQGLFSLLSGRAPTTSGAPVRDLTQQKSAAGALRASLYSTEGGSQGMDLNNDQVSRRTTLYGN